MGNSHVSKACNQSGDKDGWIIDLNCHWMAALPDHRRLVTMSIPGTHNSAAGEVNAFVSNFAQCQSKCIIHQLEIGVRFLDVRCSKYRDSRKFGIYHGSVYCEKSLEDVLNYLREFFNKCPTEVVIMRLKVREHPDHNGSDEENRSIFQDYLDRYPALFFQSNGRQLNDLTLGEVRGKIVLLQQDNLGDFYKWDDALVEDDYDAHGDHKRDSIVKGLNQFQHQNHRLLCITFCSSAWSWTDQIPIPSSARRNNQCVYDILEQYGGTGILAFDYPGNELLRNIVNKNM